MTVTGPILRLLRLEAVPRTAQGGGLHVCTRCGKDARPRRLWSCRGRRFRYYGVCFECVRWVGSMWDLWMKKVNARRTG